MAKLLMLRGLPASGKSTYAKELVDKGGWTRVNKDDLRAMMHNGKHTKGNEAMVIKARDEIVIKALNKGHNVVVDDTNFNPIHEQRMWEIAKMYKKCTVTTRFFDTPLEECIARDLKRPNSVGERVIRRMYNENLREQPEQYTPKPGLPEAIICDIDGTLAHMNGRSPYDYTKVSTDTIDEVVRGLVDNEAAKGTKILIVSGRDDTCRPDTEAWLKEHGVTYDTLLMRDSTRVREDGGKVSDVIIKREIFDKYIRDKYNVLYVLDDRNQVVNQWRAMGLKCLQVAEGDF